MARDKFCSRAERRRDRALRFHQEPGVRETERQIHDVLLARGETARFDLEQGLAAVQRDANRVGRCG
jgi:hypothetical protein